MLILQHKNEFLWSNEHDQALALAKKHLTNVPTLAFFDAKKPASLCTDASRQGVGFVLQQQSTTGRWVLIQAGSHFLTPTEAWYAVIDLELLAVVWSVMKCKVFLLGLQHFTIITDHNPSSHYSIAID